MVNNLLVVPENLLCIGAGADGVRVSYHGDSIIYFRYRVPFSFSSTQPPNIQSLSRPLIKYILSTFQFAGKTLFFYLKENLTMDYAIRVLFEKYVGTYDFPDENKYNKLLCVGGKKDGWWSDDYGENIYNTTHIEYIKERLNMNSYQIVFYSHVNQDIVQVMEKLIANYPSVNKEVI